MRPVLISGRLHLEAHSLAGRDKWRTRDNNNYIFINKLKGRRRRRKHDYAKEKIKAEENKRAKKKKEATLQRGHVKQNDVH